MNDPTTERLFDRNNNTIWVAAEPECDVIAFELDLEAPRYLSSIRLTTRGGIQPRSMGIALYRPGDKDRLGQIYYEAQLDGANPLLVELPRDHFVRLFKAGSIRVDLVGCRSQEGRMQLSEVALELSDKPVFNPEMSVSKLFESVRGSAQYSSDGFWKFSQEGDGSSRNKFEAKNKYLAHLIYYGLAGNEEARNLFEKYAPPGTASGEDISYLKTWYEQEEKARSKK